MGVKFLAIHTAQAGDTVDSLTQAYRLSSRLAITDIPANRNARTTLLAIDELPEGMRINIPPNAGELCKERLYALHRDRSSFLAHFDALQSSAESTLRSAVLATDRPFESAAVQQVLSELHEAVAAGIDTMASNTAPLVQICQGMAHTHVADWKDNAAVEAAADPLCGLYWAISPGALELWRDMWTDTVWSHKWQDKEPKAAWRLAEQFLTTVRSIVVQQIDQRIRETQALERRLQSENRD